MTTTTTIEPVRLCRSNVHPEPVPADVVGTFDLSDINGHDPEPDSAYCLKCAAMLHDIDWFTPNDDADSKVLHEHFVHLTEEAS